MALSLVTAPDMEPIALPLAKLHLRRDPDHAVEDALIQSLVATARERMETETRRQAMTATWELTLPDWPRDSRGCFGIEIPRPPLQGATFDGEEPTSWVRYVDEAGDEQTLARDQYVVVAPQGPQAARGWLRPAHDVTWPAVRRQPDAITVRFVAGYGDTSESVPAMLRSGMLLDVGALYAHRETVIVSQFAGQFMVLPGWLATMYARFKSYPTQSHEGL